MTEKNICQLDACEKAARLQETGSDERFQEPLAQIVKHRLEPEADNEQLIYCRCFRRRRIADMARTRLQRLHV